MRVRVYMCMYMCMYMLCLVTTHLKQGDDRASGAAIDRLAVPLEKEALGRRGEGLA